MSLALATAVGAVSCASLAGCLAPRELRPATATRLATALAVIAASGFLWILVLVAGSGLTQVHGVAERLTWCNDFVATHRDTLAPGAALALVGLVIATASVVVARRRQRSLRADERGSALTVVRSDQPAAFSLPGRPGQIVVTTSMLTALNVEERRVLLAHEHAHLEFGHHRYLRTTQIAAAVLPLLRPALTTVRFATERWADEEAARAVGDRTLVARTIAHAAGLSAPVGDGVLALAGSDVAARVQALLMEPPARSAVAVPLLAVVATGSITGIAASMLFMHHWIAAILGYC